MVDASPLERLGTVAEADGVQQCVVGGVVEDDGKVLLLQRPGDDFMGGIFELPSGKVETGETLDAALIREIKEETGLDVTDIHEYIDSFDYTSASGGKSRQFNFAVSVAQPEPVELQEHDACVWLSLEDEPPVTDAVKEVFRKYRQLRAVNRSTAVGGGEGDRRDHQVGAAQPSTVQAGQRVAGDGRCGHQ
ncbi:MAG: NUDIX domain-containing protein [Pseudonocardiaceae bacterium]